MRPFFALWLFGQSALALPCEVTLRAANVWVDGGYVVRSLSLRAGRFELGRTDGGQEIDASGLFLIPPFADGHTHAIDTPRGDDSRHSKSIAQGVFYALNPNNIRPPGPTPRATINQVELQAAGGGLTKPGGHPVATYTFLAQRGWLGPLTVNDLEGQAFHLATTPEEARAAVAKVKANGASFIKLYLLDHTKPTSNGLSGPVFDIAVAEAKRLGLRPIVHIESAADFRRAVSQGVYALAHMPYSLGNGRTANELTITAADARAAAKAKLFVVPTVAVTLASNDGAALRTLQTVQRKNLQLLREAGVRMAVGADQFSFDMHDEITALRSLGVFEASDIITMATTNGAHMAWPDRHLGTLTPGAEASFIAYFSPLPGNWSSQREPVLGVRAGEVLFDAVGLLASVCPKRQQN
jgi:imidazolonepropionase-like amidohydrolase